MPVLRERRVMWNLLIEPQTGPCAWRTQRVIEAAGSVLRVRTVCVTATLDICNLIATDRASPSPEEGALPWSPLFLESILSGIWPRQFLREVRR
jgi:hypothetical protein